MANASSKSKKLKDTLGELESALTTWDQIIPPAPESLDEAPAKHRSLSRHSSGMPLEMKQRTQELLNQLKQQIDDLSTDETQH